MSGIRICIDTNVFLNVINKEGTFYANSSKILYALARGKLEAVVPTLVIAEILTGYYASKKDSEANEFLSVSLTNEHLRISPLSVEIAAISSKIRANTGLRLPDAVVLGTALQDKADFLVTNDEHFPKVFGNLKVLGSKGMVAELKD